VQETLKRLIKTVISGHFQNLPITYSTSPISPINMFLVDQDPSQISVKGSSPACISSPTQGNQFIKTWNLLRHRYQLPKEVRIAAPTRLTWFPVVNHVTLQNRPALQDVTVTNKYHLISPLLRIFLKD